MPILDEGFSEFLSKQTTIDMIAKRFDLSTDYVDGNYSLIFKTRPPMHWDSKVLLWKFGTMSQMIEKHATGQEVCVVCTRGLVRIHRVSQDGPPEPDSQFFYLPWKDVTFE